MNSWTIRLIAANVVMFVLTSLAPAVTTMLMFVPAYVVVRPWTIVTYMFLHGGVWHLLFNMLGLYFFGPRLEEELGTRDFLLLYFISGIVGGMFSFLTPFVAIIGASGALFGVLLGFARYWPRESIYIWGILPIQARWMVVIMTVLSLIGGFGGSSDNIAHFAHLGGFAGGYLFLVWRDRRTRAARTLSVGPPPPSSADLHRWMRIDRDKLHEVNRAELDRITGKIRTLGAASLTQSEREFLERFSAT